MLWALVVFAVSPIAAQRLALKQQVSTVDFPLVYNGKAAPIIISTADFKVAHIAAADLGWLAGNKNVTVTRIAAVTTFSTTNYHQLQTIELTALPTR